MDDIESKLQFKSICFTQIIINVPLISEIGGLFMHSSFFGVGKGKKKLANASHDFIIDLC